MHAALAAPAAPSPSRPAKLVYTGITSLDGYIADYAEIWRAADKVVYSTSLSAVTTPRTRLARGFDARDIRALKDSSDRDIAIGGATLAAHAIAAGLVDEFHVFVNPVAVGGGTSFLPRGSRLDLELVDEHRFACGVVHLAYRARG